MNDKKLNVWLAEKIMGWNLIQSMWVDNITHVKISKKEWLPTKRVEQALICVEKCCIENKKFFDLNRNSLTCEKPWSARVRRVEDGIKAFSLGITAAEVICKAIYESMSK